jgi:translation initiation factor 4G
MPTVTINVQELSLEQVVKKINGILNKLTPEKFDSLLQQLFAIVAADNSEAYMERVVPLIFAKAIAEVKISSLYATLTRHLYGLVGAEERPAVLRQLLQLCDRLIFEIADIVSDLSEEQAQKLQTKRSGNIKFMAELYSEGVIPSDEVLRRLNYLLECAHGADSEAVFCTQLVCELLTLIGDTLPWTAVSPIMQTLPAVAARHPPRVQFLVWNLLELRGIKASPSAASKPAIKIEVIPFVESPTVSVEQSSFPRTPSSSCETPEHSPFLSPSETTSFSFCYDPYSPNLYRTPYPR